MCGDSRWAIIVDGSRATVANAGGRCPILAYQQVPRSIDQVFSMVRTQYRLADHVSVTYDRTYGFPAQVSVDPDRNAIDDEWSFGVTRFRPGPSRSRPPGTLGGRLALVGGPMGARPRPIAGVVTATPVGGGDASTVTTDGGGRFELHLSPGRYRLAGHSQEYDDPSGTCTAPDQEVTASSTTTVTVACAMP